MEIIKKDNQYWGFEKKTLSELQAFSFGLDVSGLFLYNINEVEASRTAVPQNMVKNNENELIENIATTIATINKLYPDAVAITPFENISIIELSPYAQIIRLYQSGKLPLELEVKDMYDELVEFLKEHCPGAKVKKKRA